MSDRVPVRRAAAFAPTAPPSPRCATCWSAPFLGQTRTMRRGWRVQAGEAEVAAGTVVSIASAVYPCSNPDCTTAIVVRMALTGGYLPADMDAHQLRGQEADTFMRGTTGRDGIWRHRSGEPKTAPVQRDLFSA